jgi:WD40 repeat protein
VYAVAILLDGTRIVSRSGFKDRSIRIWDAAKGVQVGEPLHGHESRVYSIAISPDGKHIFSGSSDCMIRIWDIGTGRPVGEPL